MAPQKKAFAITKQHDENEAVQIMTNNSNQALSRYIAVQHDQKKRLFKGIAVLAQALITNY